MSKSYESIPQPLVISLARSNRKDPEERERSGGGFIGLFMFLLMGSVVIVVVYLFVDDETVEEAFRLVIPNDGAVDEQTTDLAAKDLGQDACHDINESKDAEAALMQNKLL